MTNEDLKMMAQNDAWADADAMQNRPTITLDDMVERRIAFARAVTAAVLSEARARCHALIIKGEADPGNIIRVFKALNRELCSDALAPRQEEKP